MDMRARSRSVVVGLGGALSLPRRPEYILSGGSRAENSFAETATNGTKETSCDNVDETALLTEILKGSVHTAEVDFFFPFSLVDDSERMSATQTLPATSVLPIITNNGNGIGAENSDPYGQEFGDDGHLLFKECRKTIEVHQFKLDDTATRRRLDEGEDAEEISWDHAKRTLLTRVSLMVDDGRPSLNTGIQLPTDLEDSSGNKFLLQKVFIRLFSFKVGIVRFSITTCQPISIQALLNLQNSVMRLGDSKQAGRLKVTQVNQLLEPKLFLSYVLAKNLGSANWTPDLTIDRLFTVTLAGISRLMSPEAVNQVAYLIANMEWSIETLTGKSYLDQFVDDNVYKRHATQEGGLWSCFHGEGGCSLFFVEKMKALSDLLNPQNRKLGVKICGSSRPLTTLSLAEAIIFQRMYLRSLDRQLDRLILSEAYNTKSVKKLHVIHGDLLKFRTKFAYSPLSTTTAGKQQFQQWAEVIGLFDRTVQLLETTKDLHEYYQGIVDKENQKRLDILAIVLGFLGISQLITDIYLTWNNERTNDDKRRDNNLSVPIAVSSGILLFAVVFIILQQRRQ